MRKRNIHERLASGAALLALIDSRRRATRSRFLGSNIERKVIDRELRELEEDFQIRVKPDQSAETH